MASTPITRAVLKTRIAQRANTSGYVDSSTDGELSQLVDTSLAKFHNLLATTFEDYVIARSHFALVANQSTYPLPADYFKMRAVWYLTPSTTLPNDITQATGPQLQRMDVSETAQNWGAGTTPGIPYGYSLEGSSILILPASSSAANYIGLRYIPQYVPAENDQTPIEFAVARGWEEWVVNDVVINIRLKAMMPTQELMLTQQAYEARLEKQARNRDATQPFKVRRTGWRNGGGGWPGPNGGQFAFTS